MPANRRMFWNVRATFARREIRWPGIRSRLNRAPSAWARASVPEVGW